MKRLLFSLLFLATTAYGQWSPQAQATDDAILTGVTIADAVALTRTSHGNCGSTEDFSATAGFHTATLDANLTTTLSDFAAAGYASSMTIVFTQDSTGGRSITWPAAVALPAPQIDPVASHTTHVYLETSDGGVTVTASSDYAGLNAALPVDDTYCGTTITGLNAGATIAQWELVVLNSSSKWVLADANGAGLFPARGIAVAAGTNNNPLTVLVHGTVRNDGWSAWTVGGQLYLSGTAGAITQSAPAVSGDHTQQVGFALAGKIIFVDFASGEYLTVP